MKKNVIQNATVNLVILLIFGILSMGSTLLLRSKMLQNAHEMGNYLVRNYSAVEQNNITMYETLIELGTQYLDGQILNNANPEQIQTLVHDLFTSTEEMLGNYAVNLYAVVDGEIIAANPWEGMEDYPFETKQWYKGAIQANGKVTFTDAYQDIVTGKMVITVAKKAQYSDTVLIFDVSLENFHNYTNATSLPKGSSYFLFDRSGQPLYYIHDGKQINNQIDNDISKYVNTFWEEINKGEFTSNNSFIQGLDNSKKSMYYYELSNGWVSILTIPLDTILQELNNFIYIFSLIFFVFLLIIAFMTVRDFKLNWKMQRTSDIMQVLGNSYYAIYRVNYNRGTYEMIKDADDIKNKIARIGHYENLLYNIADCVNESTYQSMIQGFSLENIRKLAANQTNDFGGDYLRQFGDVQKWVNVRLFFDKTLNQGEAILCFQEADKIKKEKLQQMHLLQSALESAQRNEKSKTEFFRNMSHDMRTPLNAVIGLTELAQHSLKNLDKQDHQDQLQNYIQKIKISSKQLLNLINDVLELSRMERGNTSMHYTQIDLKQCIKECTGVFRELAQKEEKIFDVNFDIKDSIVMGDSSRISQILNNLISNAFKYSEAGAKIIVSIKQSDYQERSKYQIRVSDTGIGMSKEFLPKIFESYAQENRFSTKHIMGTGLGMPIVKHLINEMHGEITVESELGKGSTFTVTIPLEVVEQPDLLKESEDDANAITNLLEEKFTLAGKRILLVEDNEINMEIGKEVLSLNGMEVFTAWNGKEAVDQFTASTPFFYDAILMDMLMPEMNGCEATKIIRSLERPDAKSIPIIAVTANAFAEDIAMTTEAGMNAHTSKPIDFNLLHQILQDLICEENKQ